MNKTAIKNFAVNARRKLIEEVMQKAYDIGITEKNIQPSEQFSDGYKIEVNGETVYITNTQEDQREILIEQIEQKGYEQVIEEVAYTWFNRIIAIRFMEVNDYLPSGIRILSSSDNTRVEPDCIRNVRDLIDEIGLDANTVFKYQDENNIDSLFKYIFITQCNELYKIMPVMFDKINDYTELLLPDRLLEESSVIRNLVDSIDEDDFKDQVEIIGWMYQYYISEKKDKVFSDLKKNKKITKENIPAATQLFTPDWIVKYMVENSLGRLWLEGHPDEELKSGWKYYLEEAEQELDVQVELDKIKEESKKLSPEDITVLDPSMGSGHILVYAFDVLYEIYVSAMYPEKEIPRLILEKNLYGLDIDDRAGQLAYFALMMKARSKYRRFFRDIERNPIELNVCAIQESNGLTNEDIEYFANGDETLKADMNYLADLFKDAKEYGSILNVRKVSFINIENRLIQIENDIAPIMIDKKNICCKVINIIKQCKIMCSKYFVCITNPPYIGYNGINNRLKQYICSEFEDVKYDLYSVFIKKMFNYTKSIGHLGFMTPFTWMFISSYEKLREYIINNKVITSLVQLEYSGFVEATVPICSFTIRNYTTGEKGEYIRLSDFKGADIQEIKTLNAIKDRNISYRYSSTMKDFKAIPKYPIAYWTSSTFRNLFNNEKKIGNIAQTKVGMATGNNDKFVRLWHEVKICNIGFNIESRNDAKTSKLTWFPYNKGGKYRKWYGNNEYIVKWDNDGNDIRNYIDDKTGRVKSHNYNLDYIFTEGLTWTAVTSYKFSIRKMERGLFGSGGYAVTNINQDNINYVLGLLNTNFANYILQILAPTLNYESGTVEKVPFILDIDKKTRVNEIVKQSISISKNDWDSFETSWDFKNHPLIKYKDINTIEKSFEIWSEFTKKQFHNLKLNEEELNEIFINIYGLKDEITFRIENKDITIRKADREREIKSFISYAVGCMLGRYSLDEQGLIFAGGKFDESKYKIFKVDHDGIIPITDKEYFEDDIVSKFVEFVKVVFGEETLEENLEYIADTECFGRRRNETARATLRRYFLKGFIEDHIKIYQKRPIYWMFDSGRQNGFKALIYMHRYNEDTVAKVRTDYLHEIQRKYENEIVTLDTTINSDIASAREKKEAKKEKERVQKQIGECVEYDKVIAHIANQRVSIDLDDGVKVNYAKFNESEAGRLLFKI